MRCSRASADDFKRLSDWALRQQKFFNWVKFYAGDGSNDFANDVRSIRGHVATFMTEENIYSGETDVKSSQGPKGGPGAILPFRVTDVSTLLSVDVDYSYIDIGVSPSGKISRGLYFRIHASIDGGPWVNYGVPSDNGRFSGIPFSVFDPAHVALEVKFDVYSLRALGSGTLLNVQRSTYSSVFNIPFGCVAAQAC